jgi:hypothetical protein
MGSKRRTPFEVELLNQILLCKHEIKYHKGGGAPKVTYKVCVKKTHEVQASYNLSLI